ncbi:MBL fold metallo-hydrolase [Halobacteriales archaeon QS_4_69_34]|nr:MAG: MBL fold metallo-hydrolase [Halobacteriales archaeon QS_4_69_34]
MSETTVHAIDRGHIEADLNFAVDGSVAATHSDPDPDLEYVDFAVWNLVIDGPEATVLWDTGSHPEAGAGYWPAPLYEAFAHVDADEHDLEADLDDAGFDLVDIDAVVQSHLHLDHAGGLYHFEGTDTPVYVHEQEVKFAYYSANTPEGSIAYVPDDFDRDLDWEVVHDERQLAEGFELLHLPGHTPGLLGALIETDDGPLLVAGDECFVEANYREEQPMGASLTWDSRAWRESLHRLKDLERRHGAGVIFGHEPDQFEGSGHE